MAKVLGRIAWKGFMLAFGSISLASVYTTAVLKNGALWASDTQQEKEELAKAQRQFWDLTLEPIPGFSHAFHTTGKGTNLHYVVNSFPDSSLARNVVIFIHGFPDSCVLWKHLLQSPELLRNNILLAVDIPGYGGSDSPLTYGADDVLEALADYIIGMRSLFLQQNMKLVLVTHDWGTIIGSRLAAEAPGLADHYVLTSAVLPQVMRTNAIDGCASASQMLRTWIRQPSNTRLLRNAFSALSPLTTQFRRSFYIFCFNLPWPLSMFFSTFGNYWFLRILHSLGNGKPAKGEPLIGRLNPQEAGEAMATTTGPSLAQIDATSTEHGKQQLRYGESVRKRTYDRGMAEKIRIYREGLFLDRWEKSLELTATLFELRGRSSSGDSISDIMEGHLQSSATIMMGEHDAAFDQRLAFNQIKNFLLPGSQVALIKGTGHWVPLEPTGSRIMEKVILWALSEQSEGKNPFAATSEIRLIAKV